MDAALNRKREYQEAQRRERREAIIELATRTFLERGFGATTMSGIAAELGGSKTTFWSHFASKEELFEAVVDAGSRAYRERLQDIIEQPGPLPDAVRGLCRDLLIRITSRESIALLRLVIAEAERYPAMARIFHGIAAVKMTKLFAGVITRLMDQGMLRRDDPKAASRLLLQLCQMGVHHRLLLGSQSEVRPREIDADVENVLAVFLKVYGAEPGPAPQKTA